MHRNIDSEVKSLRDNDNVKNRQSIIDEIIDDKVCREFDLNIIKNQSSGFCFTSTFNKDESNLIAANQLQPYTNDYLNTRLSEIYTRPGKITNRSLIDFDLSISSLSSKYYNEIVENKLHCLKSHFQEYYDFMLVSKESWDLLSAWYGFDYEVIYDPGDRMLESIKSNF